MILPSQYTALMGSLCFLLLCSMSATSAADTPISAGIKAAMDAELGRSVPINELEAMRGYHLACKAGQPIGCFHLQKIAKTRRILDDKKRATLTTPLNQKCEAGDLVACFYLGLHFDDDGGKPLDIKRAHTLYLKACKGGIAPACSRASDVYRVTVFRKEKESQKTAQTLMEKACKLGYPSACSSRLLKGDREQSTLWPKACKMGHLWSCVKQANAVTYKPPFDCTQCSTPPRSKQCQACDDALYCIKYCCKTCPLRDSGARCFNDITSKRCSDDPGYPLTPQPIDPKAKAKADKNAKQWMTLAFSVAQQSCEAGHPQGCAKLGDLYFIEKVPTYNIDRAIAVLNKQCTDAIVFGCPTLAYALKKRNKGNDKAAADVARQRTHDYLQARCNEGDSQRCWNAAYFAKRRFWR